MAQEALAHWRNKISSSTNEWEERNRALRTEKDMMTRHYRALKSSMDHFRGTQSQRLKHLSICSGQSKTELKEKLSKSTSILKLAEMCRKMETEQEKILPFCPNLNEVFVGGSAAATGKADIEEDPDETYEAEEVIGSLSEQKVSYQQSTAAKWLFTNL